MYEDILTKILNHPDSVTLEQVAFVLSNEELTPNYSQRLMKLEENTWVQKCSLEASLSSLITAPTIAFIAAYEHRTQTYPGTE